jgi:sigma-54 dependent transcriptional regulator, acetoin dehydrogenase operon transcriptional activator AcoR
VDHHTLPAPRPSAQTDGSQLAKTRLRFLTSEPVDAQHVRDTILASWWRSRRWNVAADHIELPYVRNPNLDLPLTRSANPILLRLREQLDGQAISLILTDQSGMVLSRLTGDAGLSRHLDSVHLAPGFSYAERFVGTNGIGTALEGGRVMHVFGHEHYAENLEDLACVGVPIRHPITGKTVGAVDLTCWRRDAGPLLIALARTTADQIRQALLTASGVRELELFQAYLQTCRRTTGMVLALNNDVVMMNDQARQVLDPADQSVLLSHASEALADGRRTPVVVDLPSGNRARIACRVVRGQEQVAGGVVHVSLVEASAGNGATALPVLRLFLPGVVGSGTLWLRACHEVDRGYSTGEWLVLSGEPGTGKTALARGVHQRRNATGRMHVVDAATADASLSEIATELADHDTRALLVRHVDRLAPALLRSLTAMLSATLADARENGRRLPWVAVTLAAPVAPPPELAALLALFPSTVEIPPLRHHIEDLRELVPFFLTRLSHGNELACSPKAMQLLMRNPWAGNTEQLYQALRFVVQHRRRTGSIQPEDLPPEHRTLSRRPLSQLESMERDAIVQSLVDTGGNKGLAAKSLGMSRATIYRKIHDYGIVAPRS